MATNSVHDEIKKGEIIKADTFFKKFNAIVEPLLTKAKSNCTSLINALYTWNNTTRQSVEGSYEISDYYTFKPLEPTSPAIDAIYKLKAKLNDLEKQWSDISNTFQEPTKHNPLHKQKPNVPRASGKVRKGDFIAAYNFRAFIESLYSIVANLRNISLHFYDKNNVAQLSIGLADKDASYSQLPTYTSSDEDLISVNNNIELYSFNDYILNNTTNGGTIQGPNEYKGMEHGYVGDSLVPGDISDTVNERLIYWNNNLYNDSSIGRQITNNLASDVSNSLQSYYNVPARNDQTFDYSADPNGGIAREYLTLQPANGYSGGNLQSFENVRNTLDPYFDGTNAIRSSTAKGKSPQIVSAQTVNNLFKEMNRLFVKIATSLCGVFFAEPVDDTIVPIVQPPIGGLGYPLPFSWYNCLRATQNTPVSSNADLSNASKTIIVQGYDGLNYYSNRLAYYGYDHNNDKPMVSLNNGTLIANDQGDPGIIAKPCWGKYYGIRAGFPYFFSKSTDNFNITTITSYYTASNRNVDKFISSSIIPMLYNDFIAEYDTQQSTFVTNFMQLKNANNAYPYLDRLPVFKRKTIPAANSATPGVFAFNNALMEISCGAYSHSNDISAVKHLYNRNCVSRPSNISTYFSDIDSLLNNTELSSFDINTKYVFMPYMTYLNNMSANEHEIYNGTVPHYKTDKLYTINITMPKGNKIVNAAGIPVIMADKNDVWEENEINRVPKDDYSSLSEKYGTMQLHLYKAGGEFDYGSHIVESDFDIDWFEYIINMYSSLNKTRIAGNVDCPSKSTIIYKLFKPSTEISSKTISQIYNNKDFSVNPGYDIQKLQQSNELTSTIYVGKNAYNPTTFPNNSPIKKYLSYYNKDLMNSLFTSRYKYNDFYENYCPLSKTIKYSDLGGFCEVGPPDTDPDSNTQELPLKYTNGNVSQNLSWVTQIKGNISDINMSIQYQISANALGAERENGSQGNIIIAGNQSNKVSIIQNGEPKTYFYKFAPQPAPIEVSKIQIDKSSGLFTFTGTCKRFWNNPRAIELYVQTNKSDEIYKKTFVFANNGYYEPELRPFKNSQPLVSSISSIDRIQNKNISIVSPLISNSKISSYSINISADFNELSGILKESGSQCSCTLRLFNENGGFRDVCKSKSSSNIEDGLFRIKIVS